MASTQHTTAEPKSPVEQFFADLGPGLITGAADDDPSGISTYSIVGAAFGYGALWTALFSFPLMAAVQLMCARLGLATGRGLAGMIRRRYPRWVLWTMCSMLVVANVINIAADLSGMADATRTVTHVPSWLSVPCYGIVIMSLLLWSSYRTIARTFKWLTLVLLSYVATAVLADVDWRAALVSTILPRIEWSRSFFSALVAILGTTISPYLFFWQAAQEVEEEKAHKEALEKRAHRQEEFVACRRDVVSGMFASNAIMYFIILTTAATLHAHGITTIATAQQAADALRPLAGGGAYWLFTLGIVGTGMLAVPVLAGSSAYAIAEALAWRRASLDRRPSQAGKFYLVLGMAMLIGGVLTYAGFNAIHLLYVSAIVNGVLAPPMIFVVLVLTSDRSVMGDAVNSPLMRALGWGAFAVMLAAAAGLLFTS